MHSKGDSTSPYSVRHCFVVAEVRFRAVACGRWNLGNLDPDELAYDELHDGCAWKNLEFAEIYGPFIVERHHCCSIEILDEVRWKKMSWHDAVSRVVV